MPTPTFDLLDSVTLGSSAASVTFSNISQNYRDLVVVVRPDSTAIYPQLIIGGQPQNVNNVRMHGVSPSTVDASGSTNNSGPASYYQAELVIFQIFDYSTTNKHKTILTRSNLGSVAVGAIGSRWAYTSAVTTIQVNDSGAGNYPAGSTFYLYGIAA